MLDSTEIGCDTEGGRQRQSQNRVLRGGSWINEPRNLRAAYRNHNEPGNRNRNNGFRLAGALAPMAVASGGSLNQLPDLFHFGGQTQGLRRVSRQCRRSPIAKSLPAGRLMIFALRSH